MLKNDARTIAVALIWTEMRTTCDQYCFCNELVSLANRIGQRKTVKLFEVRLSLHKERTQIACG